MCSTTGVWDADLLCDFFARLNSRLARSGCKRRAGSEAMLAPTCISSGSLTPSPRAGCSNDLELAGAVESGGRPGGFHLRFLIPHDVRGGPQALRTCRVRSNPKPMKRERPTKTIRHEGTAEREAQPQRRFRKGVTTKGNVMVVAETGAEVPLASRQQLINSTLHSCTTEQLHN